MRKLITTFLSGLSLLAYAQTPQKEVIIANGGRFEFTGPFTDYVTVASYDLSTRQYSEFDTIFDQSVQALEVVGNRIFVASQKHVTVYDAKTKAVLHQSREIAGIRKLVVAGSNVLLTKGFGTPTGASFFMQLDSNLIPIDSIVSQETEGVAILGDTAYITEPGPFGNATCNLIAYNFRTKQLASRKQLGANGASLGRVFIAGNRVLSSPVYSTGPSKVLDYNIQTGQTNFVSTNMRLGDGIGLFNNKWLLKTGNDSIGIYSLSSSSFTKPKLIGKSFAGGAVSNKEGKVFISSADYLTNAKLWIFDTSGVLLDSVQVGVSPEAIGYWEGTSITNVSPEKKESITFYPNPAKSMLEINGLSIGSEVQLYDVCGKVAMTYTAETADLQLSVQSLNTGVYSVKVTSRFGAVTFSRLLIER